MVQGNAREKLRPKNYRKLHNFLNRLLICEFKKILFLKILLCTELFCEAISPSDGTGRLCLYRYEKNGQLTAFRITSGGL